MKMPRQPDPILDKALRLLVHPTTLLALVLLLLNDHVLRRLWPSTITGKLGDFAWLYFMPLVVLAILALLVPGRSAQRTSLLPAVARAAVGLVFTLAKTIPAAHALVVAAAGALFGFPVGWRLDPTDLVALAALALNAMLWARPAAPPRLPVVRPAPGGWIALAAAALLTVANSPAPEPGIYCLEERGGEMDAYAGYGAYRSTDGGLTWVSLPNQSRGACPNPWGGESGSSAVIVDPQNTQRQYRIVPGQSIELSEDAGATWRVIYTVPHATEAATAATRKRLSTYATIRPTPLDAEVDRATGNVVFAMGHAGVLVLEHGGAWREVAVGGYRPGSALGAGDYAGLLLGEILLGVAIALLGFATLATRLVVRGKAAWIAALALAWLIWGATVFFLPPALSYGYGSVLTYGAMLVLGVILLVLTAISLVASFQHAQGNIRNSIGRPALVALGVGLLFLLPYALWAAGAVPVYFMASVFATILSVAAIFAGAYWMLRRPTRLPGQPHDLPR